MEWRQSTESEALPTTRNLFLISPRSDSTPLHIFNFLFYADLYLFSSAPAMKRAIVDYSRFTGIDCSDDAFHYTTTAVLNTTMIQIKMLKLINLIARTRIVILQSQPLHWDQMAKMYSCSGKEQCFLRTIQIQIECNSSREKTCETR